MNTFFDRAAKIGHHENDNAEVRLQKTLLIAFSGTMGILAIFWGLLYYFYNEPVAGSIPGFYALATLISIYIFSQLKSYQIFRLSQLAFSLLLPFALMISLGGIKSSSAVIMWSLTSPLGALVFKGRKEAFYWFLAYLMLLFIGILFESKYAFSNNLPEFIINLFFVLNIAGTSCTAYIIIRYFVGEKNLAITILESKNKWVKDAFSSYISPNLVNHIIENPDKLQLGGQRRECSFIFTDLVGFTPLVEKTDPNVLITYLNEYFEGMTEIVFKHEGTISKIMGDALAVMFSAPVVQLDHAQRAVSCAMDMNKYSQKFYSTKLDQGVELGKTRIGVNTGTVLIGNVGSKNHLDYRALGDAINVAARLESVNNQLGTQVCISKKTVERCSDFTGRPIGKLILKGKSKSVLAFEPLPKQAYNSEQFEEYMFAYNLMKNNDDGALKAFDDLIQKYPDDQLMKYHFMRLSSGKRGITIKLHRK